MKKIKYLFSAVIVALALGVSMTSCNNDDDKENNESVASVALAKEMAGTYIGDASMTVSTSESVLEDQKVVIAEENDSQVSLTFPSVGSGMMTLPEITVNGLKVTGSEGSYKIAATEYSGTTDAGKSYKGTVAASSTGKQLSVNMSIQYGTMPMAMIFKFEGDKQ